MLEIVAAVALVALVKKLVDFVKGITNKDLNEILTQLTAWAAGIGATLVAAQTALAEQGGVFGFDLADQSVWTKVLIGAAVGALASLTKDTLDAVGGEVDETQLVPEEEEVVATPAPRRRATTVKKK